MSNKLLVSIIYICFISLLIGIIGEVFRISKLELFALLGGAILFLSGTYLILINGKFKSSNKFKITIGGIIFIFLGSFLKGINLPFAEYLVLMGFLGIPISYLIHLLTYRPLTWLNWVKLAFIITFVSGACFKIIHLPLNKELLIFSFLCLIIIVIEFIYNKKHLNEN